jgi:hypothetical protein
VYLQAGHVISVLCSTFITDSFATDGLISLRGQSERWDDVVGSKKNSLWHITIEVTGLRPATLGSEFKQRPQLRVHRFVMPLCCRAMDTQTLYVE